MSDKALMNKATLELTQKIQAHFPLDINADVLRAWNGCQKEFLQSCLIEVFSKMPKMKKQLEFLGTIDISATTGPFIAKEKFVIDTSDEAEVKISYLGDNFKNIFINKIETLPASSTLRYYKLLKRLVDDDIIDELGGKDVTESGLYCMFFLMRKQGRGQSGALLVNGYANIFYIRDDNSVLWAVACYWGGDGWDVDALPADDPSRWDVGDQVFSRNPSVSQS